MTIAASLALTDASTAVDHKHLPRDVGSGREVKDGVNDVMRRAERCKSVASTSRRRASSGI